MNLLKFKIGLTFILISNFAFGEAIISPIRLNTGTSVLYLSNYQINPETVRSISVSESGYHVSWTTLRDSFQLWVDSQASSMSKLNIALFDHTIITIPLIKSSKRKMNFKLDDSKFIFKSVKIKGTFNSWNPNNLELKRKRVGSSWVGECWVSEGSHQFVYVIDGGKEIRDPKMDSISNGMGGFNSVFQFEPREINIQSESFIGNTLKLNVHASELKSNKIAEKFEGLALFDNKSLPIKIDKQKPIEIKINQFKMDNEIHFIRVWVYSNFGFSNELTIPFLNGKIVKDVSVLKRYRDPHTMLIYNPMIDRFNDGLTSNNFTSKDQGVLSKVDFMGGDIAGITQKIKSGYFDNLGINTLWVSPIIKNPKEAWGHWPKPDTKFSAYHGYWPISSTQTDDRFCTPEEFREFITVAHGRKMRVLVDYVAHHIHQNHNLFKQHPDWFSSLYLPDGTKNTERWDEYRLTTWFDDFLPTFNFSKTEVVNAMTDSAVWWAKNYNIDGFRHDATKHIPENFWKTLTYKINTQIKDRTLFQIGETYGSSELIGSYLGTGLLDAQFDFNVYDASVSAFKGHGGIKNLVNTLNDSRKNYGSYHLMGNITGNQDRPRFVSLADNSLKEGENFKQAGWDRDIQVSDKKVYQQLQQLFAFNIAIPGIPVVYYGDEIGMPGANDPDCRRMMRFGEKNTPSDSLNSNEKNNRWVFSELLKLRQNYMSLIYGECNFESIDDSKLCITRSYFGEKIQFYFNNGLNNLKLALPGNIKLKLIRISGGKIDLNANNSEVVLPGEVLIVIQN